MPKWNDEKKAYEEEAVSDTRSENWRRKDRQREERFRTALLNELDGIALYLGGIERAVARLGRDE